MVDKTKPRYRSLFEGCFPAEPNKPAAEPSEPINEWELDPDEPDWYMRSYRQTPGVTFTPDERGGMVDLGTKAGGDAFVDSLVQGCCDRMRAAGYELVDENGEVLPPGTHPTWGHWRKISSEPPPPETRVDHFVQDPVPAIEDDEE